MKSFAFAAVAGMAAAIDVHELEFMNYTAKFNKFYLQLELFEQRMSNFVRADKIIKEHNATEANYTLGHNQFSDWTEEEYQKILGFKKTSSNADGGKCKQLYTESNADSVNWVTAGAVTPVKDQGACGSCWAFSTIGSLEGAHFIASGELLSFSEQQLVSCDKERSNNGCNGGFQDDAYEYYMEGNNAELESVYPYTSGTYGYDGKCTYDVSSATAVTVSDYACVTTSNKD